MISIHHHNFLTLNLYIYDLHTDTHMYFTVFTYNYAYRIVLGSNPEEGTAKPVRRTCYHNEVLEGAVGFIIQKVVRFLTFSQHSV